jgi:hypothetical protein
LFAPVKNRPYPLVQFFAKLVVMVKTNSRDRDKTVTSLIPILIPSAGDAPDGHVLVLGCDSRFPKARREQPVTRFDPNAEPEADKKDMKRFLGVARMYTLAAGQRIDYSLLQEGFRSLVEDVFGESLTDGLVKEALANPKSWSRLWLPTLFNRELNSAHLVMSWPGDQPNFGPAIYCPDLKTAYFVSLLFSRLFSGVRACQGCGILFRPKRTNQLYHEDLCGERHRKRRERRRKKKGVSQPSTNRPNYERTE